MGSIPGHLGDRNETVFGKCASLILLKNFYFHDILLMASKCAQW